MFFWILFLAHLIGDFPLQTDYIYRLKTRYTWGVLPHVLICTAVNILLLYPFLHHPATIGVIIFLLIVHFFLDRTKIIITQKIAQDNFLQFILDQFFHFASVWIAAQFLKLSVPFSEYSLFGTVIYQGQLVRLTAFVLVIFAGTPILYYILKNSYRKEFSQNFRSYPKLYNRFPGFIERGLSLFGLLSGSWLLILYPAAFLPKLVLDKRFPLKLRLFRFFSGMAFVAICALLVFIFG